MSVEALPETLPRPSYRSGDKEFPRMFYLFFRSNRPQDKPIRRDWTVWVRDWTGKGGCPFPGRAACCTVTGRYGAGAGLQPV